VSLSPGMATQILEMAEDSQIETHEVSSLMYGVFNTAIIGMVILFGAKAFIKVVKPPKEEAKEIIETAEMF